MSEVNGEDKKREEKEGRFSAKYYTCVVVYLYILTVRVVV